MVALFFLELKSFLTVKIVTDIIMDPGSEDGNDLGINFKMVGFIHDEYQTEVIGTKEEAEELGKLQAKCMEEVGVELGFRIPTPGSFDVGINWLVTH
jgi:hypothetical protein